MMVTLDEVKAHLRVTHSADDALIQRYIDASESEALQFLNLTELPESPEGSSSEALIADDVRVAIYLLVQARYDAEKADEMGQLRRVAETMLHPHRVGLGV